MHFEKCKALEAMDDARIYQVDFVYTGDLQVNVEALGEWYNLAVIVIFLSFLYKVLFMLISLD